MPWVRFDDQFSIHRKVAGLSDAAFRLHVSAIFWSARNLTDGFLPREDLDDVCARVRTPERFAAECVHREAWHPPGEPCDSPKCPAPVEGDGWVIHDYFEYQPSKEQVMRDRESAAKRQAKWRAAHNGVSNGSSNGVTNATPTRPPLKGEGAPARAPRGAGRAPPLPPHEHRHQFIPGANDLCVACQYPEPNRRHLEEP